MDYSSPSSPPPKLKGKTHLAPPTLTLALALTLTLASTFLSSYISVLIIPDSFSVKESSRNTLHRTRALIAWAAEQLLDRSRIRRARVTPL